MRCNLVRELKERKLNNNLFITFLESNLEEKIECFQASYRNF
jgi:hypothetical protein